MIVYYSLAYLGQFESVDANAVMTRRDLDLGRAGSADVAMKVAVCPTENELHAFLLGDLPERALDDLAEHLESCSKCEAIAQRYDSHSDSILDAIRTSSGVVSALSSYYSLSATGETPFEVKKMVGVDPVESYAYLQPPIEPNELGLLAHYRVKRQLGKGGMGIVFLAEDSSLSRTVALKVMNPKLTGERDGGQRFLREARIMAAVKDAHLVSVYQAGQVGDVYFLAMELLEGASLSDWMDARPDLSFTMDLLHVAEGIASGLAAVHRHGLLHRDLKPGNIWVEQTTQHVKILDFGLARFVDDDVRITKTGVVVGTPLYMSPEQTMGDQLDSRSDLFSLGCVLYWMFAGREPFYASNTLAILASLAVDSPTPLHELNPTVPKALSDLIMQLLEKLPEDRPNSAELVVERIRRIIADPVAQLGATSSAWSVLSRRARKTLRDWRVKTAILAVVFGALCFGCGLIAINGIRNFMAPQIVGTWAEPPDPNRTYVKDLPVEETVHWPFANPPGMSIAHFFGSNLHTRVIVQNKESPNGIFMHPPVPPNEGQPASISYRLDRHYAKFRARVAMNDGPPRTKRPFNFNVYGDGKLLWKSEPVEQGQILQKFDIPVENVDVLKIEVMPQGDAYSVHAVWIEPAVVKKSP